jgi:apolipoprotein D and lipocalin family protein
MKTVYTLPFVLACLLSTCVAIPDGAEAVKPFDTQRYLGTWYEVVRTDNRFERGLDNVTATYSKRDDGLIRVHNQGHDTKKGKWNDIVGKAKPVDDSGQARLKVSFFGPLYSGYNVIALDADYRHALVVGNDMSYVWLLSREPDMPADVRKAYMDKAHALGADTAAFIHVRHDRSDRPTADQS